MRTFFLVFIGLFLNSSNLVAQKDSLQLDDSYWEDQLYIAISYNTLLGEVSNSGFSYGLSTGFIKDIPLEKKGRWALGIGVGYNYDGYNHNLRVNELGNITANENISASKIRLHNFEFPIQIRWRTSDAKTYSFWRIYTGVRLNYNFKNTFKYVFNNQNYTFKNIASYQKFQTGLELSAGYGVFNFYIYYGVTPMYKNTIIKGRKLDTKIAKFGLIFYIL